MKLESQVCTLSQAKRLKELGIEQGISLCSWRTYKHGNIESKVEFGNPSHLETFPNLVWYDAYSVAELGQMLPSDYESVRLSDSGQELNGCKYWCVKTDYSVECEYCSECQSIIVQETKSSTEAEARASLLIQLLESNLVTASDCNKRLANG